MQGHEIGIPTANRSPSTMCTTADDLRAAMIGYQAGNGEAFDSLYAGLAPLVRAHLRRIGADSASLDDLVQDTFLQLHRARRTYDPARPVAPWACAIARHAFLMHCRYRRRRFFAAHDPLEEDTRAAGSRDEATLTASIAIRQALPRLAPDVVIPMLLHDVAGLKFAEIAQRLCLRATAVRARVSRGRARLRGLLRGSPEGTQRHALYE